MSITELCIPISLLQIQFKSCKEDFMPGDFKNPTTKFKANCNLRT